MSLKMIQAFKTTGLPSTERLVAYMLADHHNDSTGRCDPTVQLLVSETGLSERAVRYSIQRLSEGGHLTIKGGEGRRNIYLLHPIETDGTPAPRAAHPGTTCTPAPDAPRHEMPDTPAPDAASPRHHVPHTPAPRAAKPEGTGTDNQKEPEKAKMPSVPKSGNKARRAAAEAVSQSIVIPKDLDSPEFREAWDAVCGLREDMAASSKQVPWTERAAAAMLRQCADMGEAWAIIELNHSVSNSYRGIFPDQRRNPADVRSQPMLPGQNGKNGHARPLSSMETAVQMHSEDL